MVLDQRVHRYLAPVRVVLTATVAPIQYVVSTPINWATAINANLSSRQTLLVENSALRAKQLLLQAELQKLIALQNENTQLRELLKSSPRMQNERMTVAQLLAVTTDPLVSELILNQGLRNGVYEGQPVLDGKGIMGQVIQVGPFTSRVLLITDLRSAVPVQDARSSVRGLIVGRGNLARLALTNIPDTVDVRVGDVLLTSGLGGRYPYGYPVGVVSAIQHHASEKFTKIEATPSAQLERSEYVLLMWPQKAIAIDVPKPAAKLVTKNSGKRTS